ncbi:hypothetical protein E2C01_097701 [Portunus trituberculatus]|uniref:Uncharacterized protein n=1 Tax=Portunus trituberculatus TaxID=210409 RepID=A0A5B7JVW4_PORTR|nr:hypothetical protein [Portunus trituberculatus]
MGVCRGGGQGGGVRGEGGESLAGWRAIITRRGVRRAFVALCSPTITAPLLSPRPVPRCRGAGPRHSSTEAGTLSHGTQALLHLCYRATGHFVARLWGTAAPPSQG